ncbi:uncharacterized protein LY89DRAFT_680072 [Mollisia scopiformis]|uniref:Zn(2)-C6 fungal-type domain-containing protein n=1 Tax=Mollisia scopiformis TaxID=149040 RepID=A0A194XUB8_MOLSC|nr:uncharacterized protein LY89DRAFT_680072 [Mollisia scopiformis]KUJ23302.1 hypothetical protein LY89DRAFT_680072 [Mollisia scopiformis]
MKSSGRACGTCKDRRISCDRGFPICLQCIRSNRKCQGYEIRLSWPRRNDRKRSILGKTLTGTGKINSGLYSPVRIVNTSTSDIELYHYLASTGFGHLPCLPIVPRSISWTSITTDTDYNLLQYFTCVASSSLTAMGPCEGSPELRDVLIRVALSPSTSSSSAVLHSLLALSSLHRHGFQSHAARMKLSALSDLATSAKTGVDSDTAVSHIAALMLLCCFEIQHSSETSNLWIGYISSVKTVLKAANIDKLHKTGDLAALLYWASYHDVLAPFSLHYWGLSSREKRLISGDHDILVQNNNLYSLFEAFNETSYQCHSNLRKLSDVLTMILQAKSRRAAGLNHKDLLAVLEWKIRSINVPIANPMEGLDPSEMVSEKLMTEELFKLALFIFVERSLGDSSTKSEKLRSRTRSAFHIFSRLESLHRQFPLLIIANEARTDEDRLIVLDLISRTEENRSLRCLRGMKETIQSLWAQDDLAEKEPGYTEKIRAVLSSGGIMPSFI